MGEGHSISRCARVALILIAGCFALACASCGGGGGGPDPVPPAQRLTLSGRVVDAAGNGIASAAVLLALNETTTDSAGNFSYSNLLPGSYTLNYQDPAGNFGGLTVTLGPGSTSFTLPLPANNGEFRVTGVEPRLAEQNVVLDSEIRLMFSEAVNAASVSVADFTIVPDLGELSLTVSGNEVILRPRLQLPPAQTVLVEVDGDITAQDGTLLGHPVRWRFRTAATDTVEPAAARYDPRLRFDQPAAEPRRDPRVQRGARQPQRNIHDQRSA